MTPHEFHLSYRTGSVASIAVTCISRKTVFHERTGLITLSGRLVWIRHRIGRGMFGSRCRYGCIAWSNASNKLGIPGNMHTLPFTRTTGTQSCSVGNITSDSRGKRAIRFWASRTSSVSGMSLYRCRIAISIRRRVSSLYSSGSLPNAFAIDSYVISSGVGPIPPLVTTQS